MDLDLLKKAFPVGYLPLHGTMTVGGHHVILLNKSPAWVLPNGTLSRPGHSGLEPDRQQGLLLPDLGDPGTFTALLRLLASRAAMDGSRGLLWAPRSKSVRNTRGFSEKHQVGWTLKNATTGIFFTIEEKDPGVALVHAVQKTNCRCGAGYKSLCPQHGETGARTWSIA